MPIKVHFRGPMLFMTDYASGPETQDVVDRVVIPDSRGGGQHDDGSRAVPHTAGVLVIESGRPPAHAPLAGRMVEIAAEGETRAPGVDPVYLAVPPVHEMTNPDGKARPVRRRIAANWSPTTVTFKGGTMSGEMVIPNGIELLRHKAAPVRRPVTAMPIWRSDAATGAIRITDRNGTKTIPLGPNVTVYIYNWDDPTPTAQELTDTTVPNRPVDDDDFKWIYRLLTPDQKTWQEWLEGEPRLPAPRVVLQDREAKGLHSPSITTCNSARSRGVTP